MHTLVAHWHAKQVCNCHAGGWKCDRSCVQEALAEESLFYPVGSVSHLYFQTYPQDPFAPHFLRLSELACCTLLLILLRDRGVSFTAIGVPVAPSAGTHAYDNTNSSFPSQVLNFEHGSLC